MEEGGAEDMAAAEPEPGPESNYQPPQPTTPVSPPEKPSPSNENYGLFDENIGNKLPTPPSFPEKDTSGFHAYVPPTEPVATNAVSEQSDVVITPDQTIKAQKYCKWAGSALNYDDVKAAIDNLQKALRLLQTGRDE